MTNQTTTLDLYQSVVGIAQRIEWGALTDVAEILAELDRVTIRNQQRTMLAFTVFGNQEDPKGNPVPYTRMTRGSKWNERAQKYLEWKERVIAAYEKQVKTDNALLTRTTYRSKPIKLHDKQRAQVWVFIEWKDGTHADGDNVLKGILDALFVNDKQVTEGHFYSQMSRDRQGSVRVVIEIIG